MARSVLFNFMPLALKKTSQDSQKIRHKSLGPLQQYVEQGVDESEIQDEEKAQVDMRTSNSVVPSPRYTPMLYSGSRTRNGWAPDVLGFPKRLGSTPPTKVLLYINIRRLPPISTPLVILGKGIPFG